MAEKTFHSLTLPGQDTARVPLTAAEFSTSVAYKVKDYCTYQGKLYRCTVAHAAGAWNASHFVETDVDAELDRKLDIPPSQASAPANPRVGDLWIDNDENSPVYNVDVAPTLGSTNAVQSGGTKIALNAIDSRKVEHGCITGDFSASVDYRVGDLVFYATTANGITTRTLYRCTTDHNATAWNAAHFTATTLEVELQRVRDNEANTDMIGDLFGAKTTYAVGDYCIYNDNLYRCVQAVDNTEVTTPAFDPDDWTQVALANDVSDLKNTLDVLADTQTKSVFNRTVSGIGILEVTGLNISAGIYNLHVDSVESSDTTDINSAVLFYSNNTQILGLALDRNVQIDQEISLSAFVTKIIFYAAGGWRGSQGKTFSFNNFNIYSKTGLGERLDNIEANVNATNATVETFAEGISFIKQNIIDTSEENWYSGRTSFPYTSSTFSGFATNWTTSSAKYLKSLKFSVSSRANTNITEIRVRIECGSFAIERSISVDIGSEQTLVTFPVETTVPAGVVWVGIAANQIAKYMFGDESVQTGYEYWTNGDMSHLANLKNAGGSTHRLYLVAEYYEKEVYIPDQFISQKKLSFAEEMIPENLVNIDNPAQCKKGWWYYSTAVGYPITLTDVSQYNYTGLTVETYGAEQITVDTFPAEQSPPKVYWIGAADENMILLSYSIADTQVPITYTMPASAKYVLISLQSKEDQILQKLMVVQGTAVTKYAKGTGLRYKLKQCILEDDEDDSDLAFLKLPASYDLVVGDTFQLFKKGIINTVNPDWFDIQFICAKGTGFERMFELTPSTAETLQLQVMLFNQNHILIDLGVVNLNIHAKATSPANQTYVLCVGDSLTTGGSWPLELNRRLTGSGGSPAGDNLSNIEFIGTRDRNGTHYEGYGGWTFNSYNTAQTDINAKVITCTHNKTEVADQHSIYKDANNAQWKLETIEVGQIKIIAVSGDYGRFPSTGTLTWVSGGTNHSDIIYTASQNAPGNPFWNSTQNKVDFSWYCGQLGVPRIDYVFVLLGWNNAAATEDGYKVQAQTFIDNVHASFPNAKIVLMGLQIPARDGLGVNYGAIGVYSNYYGLMQYVHNLDAWYEDLVASNTNVYHINISGQFDTEHNMPTGTRTVNTRNTETETYQTNGVHPAESGYLQIADAAYRSITGLL